MGGLFQFPENFQVFDIVAGTFDSTESYTVDFEFPVQGHGPDFCQYVKNNYLHQRWRG